MTEFTTAPGNWFLFLSTVSIITVVIWVLRTVGSRYLAALATRTETELDDLLIRTLNKTHMGLVLLIAVAIGLRWLELPPLAHQIAAIGLKLALFAQIAIWVHLLLNTAIVRLLHQDDAQRDPTQIPGLRAVSFISRLIVWSLLLLFALDNLGVNVGTMIAGLGIGGIAIALALQNTLSDLFCFVSILLDKPFTIGDFVIVGDYMGTVEHVGIKTTRIKSLHGEQIIVSNNDMVSSRIKNYKRMEERRVSFTIGVVYDTAADKLARIPDMIKQIIQTAPHTRLDRVHFARFGDFSLNFECVYYVLTSDYNAYMDIQQSINYATFRKFEAESIEFAFPTQTLHVNSPVKNAAESKPLA